MPLNSVTPWLAASVCSTGCCLEGWILAQFLSHHESLQCCLPLGLCAELALCTCSVPTAPKGAHSVLTSRSVQCCSSLRSFSSCFSCWFQVEQPVVLTHVCVSLEWGAWCCGSEDEDAGEQHQWGGRTPVLSQRSQAQGRRYW